MQESRGNNQVCHPTPYHPQGQIPFTPSQEAPFIHNPPGQPTFIWPGPVLGNPAFLATTLQLWNPYLDSSQM